MARLAMRIEAAARRRVGPAVVTRLRKTARRLVEAASGDDAEVGLILTGDARIQWMNWYYRKKDKPTDVLAFAMQEGHAGHVGRARRLGDLALDVGMLGDVVISVATAARQAPEHGLSFVEELEFLFVHGLCHLLGYDHRTDAEERRMNRRMRALLKQARQG